MQGEISNQDIMLPLIRCRHKTLTGSHVIQAHSILNYINISHIIRKHNDSRINNDSNHNNIGNRIFVIEIFVFFIICVCRIIQIV